MNISNPKRIVIALVATAGILATSQFALAQTNHANKGNMGAGMMNQQVAPNSPGSQFGSGMMGGQHGSGMMGGQHGSGMMGGQHGSGMMGGQHGSGMMGGQHGSGMMGGQHGSGMMGGQYGPGMMGSMGPGMMGSMGPGMMGSMGPGMMGSMGPGMMGGMGPGMMGGMGPGMMGSMGPGMMGSMGPGMMGHNTFSSIDEESRNKINSELDSLRFKSWEINGLVLKEAPVLRNALSEELPDPATVGAIYANLFDLKRQLLEAQLATRNTIKGIVKDASTTELQTEE